MEVTAVCSICGLEKPTLDFYKNRRGIHASCKTCYIERNKGYQKRYRDENRFAIRMKSCRARAKEKGIPFGLTTEYLQDIWTGVCPAFNIPLDINAKRGKVGHAQLDKVDPSKGYVQGNVVWLSERANRIKDDATLEDLERLAAWLKSW
jgi:hypothetical protein